MIVDYDSVHGAFELERDEPSTTPWARFISGPGWGKYGGVRRRIGDSFIHVRGKYVLFNEANNKRITVIDWFTGTTVFTSNAFGSVHRFHIERGHLYLAHGGKLNCSILGEIPLDGRPPRVLHSGALAVLGLDANRACLLLDTTTMGILELETGTMLRKVPWSFAFNITVAFRHIILGERCKLDLMTGVQTALSYQPDVFNDSHVVCKQGGKLLRIAFGGKGQRILIKAARDVSPLLMCRDSRHIIVGLAGYGFTGFGRMIVDAYASEAKVLALLKNKQLERLLTPYLIPNTHDH
jgi:hypothetical protein